MSGQSQHHSQSRDEGATGIKNGSSVFYAQLEEKQGAASAVRFGCTDHDDSMMPLAISRGGWGRGCKWGGCNSTQRRIARLLSMHSLCGVIFPNTDEHMHVVAIASRAALRVSDVLQSKERQRMVCCS
jgi:hypothetical protein